MPATEATNLVGGAWVGGTTEVEVRDPSTGEVVGTVQAAGPELAREAADRAAEALPAWSGTTARRRADVLHAAAAALRSRRGELGTLLAREAGKRLPEALGEIDFSAEYLRWFAEVARRPTGEIHAPEAPGRRHLSVRRPTGVAVSLTPWNFPVSIQARKLAPMLAAGCTVVARTSQQAPLAATELVRCLAEAGLPDGAINLVHGPAGEQTTALLDHPAVRVVSFTGSTAVGRSVAERAGARLVRPLLELGGNAPFVVLDDADLDAAVEGAVLGRLRNTGQSCVAANRFYVHRAVAGEFAERLAAAFDALRLGPAVPDDGEPQADLGPMIDEAAAARVRDLVAGAVSRGGELLTRRTDAPAEGCFLAPALVAVADPQDPLVTTEVFGPAAGIVTVDDEDEAYALANASEQGLAAYAWTRDATRAWRASERLEAGVVGINDPLPSVAFAPMGGINQSGLGREGADIGMHEFQDVRHVAWRDGP